MTLHFLFYKAIAEHSFVFQMSLNSCPQLYISYIIMNILYIAYIVHVEQTKLYFNTSECYTCDFEEQYNSTRC